MATQIDVSQGELREEQGLVLVRRFTDELKGETALERATISAQQEQDAREKQLRRMRMEALYRDQGHASSEPRFHELETARLALDKACKQLETEEKPSTLAKMGIQRKSARTTANEAMLNSFVHDFQGLRSVVERFESQWKDGQKDVGHRFRRVCQKLDDHKAAFAIFPSQNVYTSTLCGSLAVIVGAAVTHGDIAERLSEMVADIADKATRAANMVMIYPTKNFRELFSKLYAQVFLFYRDAIHWYAKSKVSRAFDSFNANLTKPYEKAVEQIESHLTEIYREAEVAKSAQMAVFVEDLEARLRHQREQATEKEDLVFAGRQGQRLLLQMHESACIEAAVCCTNNSERIQSVEDELASASTDDILDRAEVKALSGRLVKNVIGSEGPSLFKDGRFWLPEVDVSLKLSDWISPDTPLSTLWISSPALSQGFSSSRAAAMVAAVAAWDSELPVISHFCERPRSGSISQGCTIEKAGLLGLVYSLTIQLLQFNVKDDAFHFPREQFEGLDGSEKSWPDALLVLQELLRATPHLQRCIIDGLNDLAFSSGAEWCGTFLAMLLEHQRTSASGFKILLTTTGQSRVLPEYIQAQNRAFVQGGAREVIRGGKWLNAGSR